MKNGRYYLIIVVLITANISAAQDTVTRSYFSLGSSTAGIGFGKAKKYNGLRFNINDARAINEINGINISVVNTDGDYPKGMINGLAINLLGNRLRTVNGISIGGIGNDIHYSNGICLSSIVHTSIEHNGLAGSVAVDFEELNGIAISALAFYDVLNGVSISILGHNYFSEREGLSSKGVVLSLIGNNAEQVDGVVIGSLNNIEHVKGMGLGVGMMRYLTADGITIGLYISAMTPPPISVNGGDVYAPQRPVEYPSPSSASATGLLIGGINLCAKVTGLQIGLFNDADELHGVQVGVLNHAKNSSLPWLPFINVVL